MVRIIESVAGAGKTTEILKMASVAVTRPALIVTYTNQNKKEITERIQTKKLKNIEIITWDVFLLKHLLRPYFPLKKPVRVNDVDFTIGEHTRYGYFNKDKIYNEKLSNFIFKEILENKKISALVFNRLSQIYTHIYLDEAQDLSGFDYQIVEYFLDKKFISIVGDPRQKTYSTNHGVKNKKKDKSVKSIFDYLKNKPRFLDMIEINNTSRRCPKTICELASLTHANLPNTLPDEGANLGTVKYIAQDTHEVLKMISQGCVLLTNKVNSFSGEHSSFNIGEAKGKEFKKVILSIPNDWVRALRKKDCSGLAEESKNRLYVGITRAMEELYIIDEHESSAPNLLDEIFRKENELV